MAKIIDATVGDVPAIQQIAQETWWPTYSSIVPQDQLRYMFDTIYSEEALRNVLREESEKFILLEDGTTVGFASYGLKPENQTICKIHKLYVLPEKHGKGYGKILIGEIKNRMILRDIHTLILNVYRLNKAVQFYEKAGFTIQGEEHIPFGPYQLNDYVMRLEF